ncbi:hypothetical protein FXO38_29675, partial [Capsicum annuum]
MALKGSTLQFIYPILKDGIKVVKLDKAAVEKQTMLWKNAMILYVVGDSPTIRAVARFLGQWEFQVKPVIYYHNNGYFVIKCSCSADRDQMLVYSPHIMNNRSVIVKSWRAKFNFSNEMLKQYYYG